MIKYLFKRLATGLLSIIAVVAIVMVLIYSLSNRDLIFAQDSSYSKKVSNEKITYRYTRWQQYGYLDYVTYADWLKTQVKDGVLAEEDFKTAVKFANTADENTGITKEYVEKFRAAYEANGYTVEYVDAEVTKTIRGGVKVKPGGNAIYFAHKDKPLYSRMLGYFANLLTVDNIHYVEEDIGERGLTFTWHDPAYGGDTFAPAIMGNGTKHKYLLYFDDEFPYIHQNLLTIRLGLSYSVDRGTDVFETMTRTQGSFVKRQVTYPTGLVEESADNIHTATYQEGSSKGKEDRFVDDYANVSLHTKNMSKMGFSFVIGILATILAYFLGVPLGILMARRKDKLVDKVGTFYIVFILAVPSLAYIFLFRAIGQSAGLPANFNMEATGASAKLVYILPIVSLALPAVANLMKWLRRYMIDQMNSDYVKFARAGGLSEGEIFTKHIFKNAAIPIVHGIPAEILFAMTGAIITESVYVVPGAGKLLTEAIGKYDNSVIVGLTLFYATLSVVSLIVGDILMALVDPRINFSSKAR